MRNRRDFLKTVAGATAGVLVTGGGFADAARQAPQATPAKRREVFVGGKRVKVVDMHAHCVVPEVWDVVKDTPLASSAGNRARGPNVMGPDRLKSLDDRGIDVQVLSINGFWFYAPDRELASKIVKLHDEKLSEWCKAHYDRYVGLYSVALQFPDLGAEQLEHAVKEVGARGAAIGGHVMGEDLSGPRFDPFWAKAQELGVIVFMHPQSAENVVKPDGLKGKGDLGNIIGNPLDTAVFLTRMMFDGTLDRFPGLKICAAHGGGYLPSYAGRSDFGCVRFPEGCKGAKKHASEYLRQLYFDSMVFTPEGLRHLVAECGVSQIMIGTDYPFKWSETTVDHVLNTPGLSDQDKRAILGENAAKLL